MATFSKKAYQAIAEQFEYERLCYHSKGVALETLKHMTERLADMLEHDNQRFNRERFLRACGL